MLTISLSHALWEIQTDAVNWPATTKPWLTATALGDRGTQNEYLETFTAHTATEFAARLHISGAEPLHMLCGMPCADCWDVRDLVSVHVGKVAETAVVVVRDREGGEFCPDSPTLPVSVVKDQVLVARVAERRRPSLPTPMVSMALNLHQTVARKAAAAKSTTEACGAAQAST